jgi:hypothetical protein
MKNIIVLLMTTLLLSAKINFAKHIDENVAEVALAVTNIAKSDFLNLRKEPSAKSKSLYKIPYDAKNLISYDKSIVKKIGKNVWVSVRLGFSDGFYNGWVKGRYIKLYRVFASISSNNLMVIYPDFLEAEKTKDGWAHLFNKIDLEHYSGCELKEQSELLDELSRFDIKLKVYYSLRDVFLDNGSGGFDVYEKVTKNGWFKNQNGGFVEPIRLYGHKGYKNITGAKGCGVNSYYFKIHGKILVIKEPFDNNPPMSRDNKPLPKGVLFSDKDNIMGYIIKNLRVF